MLLPCRAASRLSKRLTACPYHLNPLQTYPQSIYRPCCWNQRILQWSSTPCHQRNHHPLQEVDQRSPAQKSVAQGYEQTLHCLVQGCTGITKGTNTIFFLLHADIWNIPSNRTVTYARIVINYCPQNEDPNRVCFTVGGNLIDYPFELTTCTADMVSSKILWNSVISTKDAHFASADIKNMYLETP